jgi:hypothetical protein
MPTTTEPNVNTREALAAARTAIDAAVAATAAADEGVAQAEQGLAAAEAAVIDTLAEAALTSDSGSGRVRITKARADVEKARDNVEVAHLMRQAADVAYARAVDDAGRAQRAVSIEAYLEARREHIDPSSRVNILQAELPGLIVEFLGLVEARDALHARLAQELQHLTEDERATVGQHVVGGVGQTGPRPVFVRTPALLDVLKQAGLEVGGR